MKEKRRVRLWSICSVGASVATLLVAVAFYLRTGEGMRAGSDPETSTAVVSSVVAPELKPVVAEVARQSRREVLEERASPALVEPRKVILTGLVKCSVTAGSLDATVRLEDVATYTSCDDPYFAIESIVDGSSALRIEAEGYRGVELPVEHGWLVHDLGTVLLEPEREIRVNVRDRRGAAVRGAEVELLGIGALSHFGERRGRSAGVTDESGLTSVSIGRTELLIAVLDDRCSDSMQASPSDRELVLVLEDEGASGFGLRDPASGAPLVGVALRASRVDGYPPLVFEARTSDDGVFARPVPPGRYRVEGPGGRVHFVSTSGVEASFPANAASQRFAIVDVQQSGDVTWLPAKRSEDRYVEVYCRDSGNRLAPLHAWLTFFEVPPFMEMSQWVRMGGDIHVARDGRFSLYTFQTVLTSSSSYRLYLGSPGYGPVVIEDPRNTVHSAEEPHRVWLERAPERRLRVLAKGGAPHRRRLYAREAPHGVLAFEGVPDSDGVLGPFGWNGGEIALHAASMSYAPVLAQVDAADLEAANEVEVRLSGEGAIVVDVPSGVTPRIEVAGAGGVRYRGQFRGGTLRFESLPAGGYEVGPEELLDTIDLREARGRETYSIRVSSGATTRVAWDPAWTPPAAITGRVRAPGMEGTRLWVVPRYDASDLPLGHTGGQARFRVREDGTYHLDGLRTLPTRLMFARQDAQGMLVPLGVAAPGDDVELRCTKVVVVAKGAPPEAAMTVTCTPVVAGIRCLATVRERGSADQPLDIGWIPSETPFLQVILEGMHRVDLDLRPGAATTAVLDVGSLRRTGR